ncbi:hypothetical protein PAXRUDRAFT_163861, partial [Paxillus rubicundulus Ve08.2h10]
NIVDANGKPVYTQSRKILKDKIHMGDTKKAGGTVQSLCFRVGEENPRVFKVTKTIRGQ